MSLTQGLQLPFGIQQVNPVPVDSWSGPYEGSSLQDVIDLANLTIPSEVRFQSMEVRLIVGGESKKFWYKDGVYDIDLVEFLIGPQGATGPQGPTGPQGLTGATGAQGPSGSVTYTDGSLNTTSYSLAGNINSWEGKITKNFTRAYAVSDVNNYLGLSDIDVTTGTIYVVQNKSTTRNIIVRPLNNVRFLQPSGSEGDVEVIIKPNTYVRFTLTNTTGGSDRVFMVEVINPLGVAYTEQTRNTSSLATAQDPANLSSKITKNFTRAYVTSDVNNYLALSDLGKVIGDFFVVRNQSTTLPITVVLLNNARFLGINGLTTTASFQIQPSTYARFTLMDTASGSEKIFMVEVIGPSGPQGEDGSITYTEESVTTESISIAQDTDGIGFDLGKITKNFTRAFVSSPTNNYLGLSNVDKIVGDFFVVRNQSTTTSINVLMLNNARLLGTNGFETVQTFEIKPNTYARFTLVNTTGGSDKVFMVEVINALGVATKTQGLVYGDSESYFTQTVLPYDINTVSDGAESSSFKLPDTTFIGKEIIVDVMGNNCRFYGFNGGLAFETAVNGSGSQIIAAYNDLIKFTSIGGNYWLVEYLPRVYPTLNGKSLVTQSAVYTFTTSNTTSPLSLSALNTSYPNSSTIYDFKVFCPNITGGGLVYIKTGVSTWVSQSITTVS